MLELKIRKGSSPRFEAVMADVRARLPKEQSELVMMTIVSKLLIARVTALAELSAVDKEQMHDHMLALIAYAYSLLKLKNPEIDVLTDAAQQAYRALIDDAKEQMMKGKA